MKICKTCGTVKELDAFNKLKANKDGRTSMCKLCDSVRRKRLYKSKPEIRDAVKRRNSAARAADPEGHLERNREWQAANRDYAAEYSRQWRARFPEQRSAQQAMRRANELQATPKMPEVESELNSLVIIEAYSLSKLRRIYTGFEWHVDHIVPLRSSLVCGFHCYRNIRVIPAKENIMKSNKYWEGM